MINIVSEYIYAQAQYVEKAVRGELSCPNTISHQEISIFNEWLLVDILEIIKL